MMQNQTGWEAFGSNYQAALARAAEIIHDGGMAETRIRYSVKGDGMIYLVRARK